MNEKDLLRLEFDLYSRHHIITQAVRALAGEKSLQLLDAGGRSGLIQTFMPEQDLTVVDIREPETDSDKKLKKQNKYFLGSVLQMPLPDRSVDLALSLEMLEHMTAEERPRALAEMLRVSRMGIIFSFPQDSVENDQAERLINTYYKRVAGEEHPWLKEHIENRPLPQPKKLEAAIRDLGLEFVRLSSSNTYLWTLMRYYIFSTHGFHTDTEALFEFYNKHIADVADAVGPSYRSIYVAVRPEFAPLLRQLPKQTSGKTPMPQEVLTLLDKVFDSVTTQLEKKTQHIVNLEALAQAKDELIVNLGKQIKDKDTHIHNLEEQAGAKDLRIVDLEQHIQAKDTHIRNTESAQHLQESLLASLQELIQAKETHIRNLESAQTAQDVHVEDLQAHVKQQKVHITSQEKVISELKVEVSRSLSSLRQELEFTEAELEQDKQQAQQFAEDKQEQIDGLVGQLKQQAKVVQHLDQTIQAKDTHIRNIQPTFDEMQSFRRYAFMRWLFAGTHQAGAWALHTRQRARHLVLAGHIWRTQGAAEVVKSLKRYVTGTSIAQSPLQTNAMPLNEQYKLLRESQLLSKLQLKEQMAEAASWRTKPLVSIVMGAYFVDPRWLEKCLDAIHQQTYSQFEVVVTLHPDLEEKSMAVLKKWAKKDQRIRLVTPEQLHGATSLWNAGLRAAKGEYVLLVAGDDELPVHALYHLMKPLQADHQFDLIYGDEDTVQTDGTLINPHFKSDFNPDLLLSMNYFGHPVVFR
ncbi:MAG: glycosyltransferase, partial [Patescibacteria group bacterium]